MKIRDYPFYQLQIKKSMQSKNLLDLKKKKKKKKKKG